MVSCDRPRNSRISRTTRFPMTDTDGPDEQVEIEMPSVSQSETTVDDDNESSLYGNRSKPTSAKSHLKDMNNILIEEEESSDQLDAGDQRVSDGRTTTQIDGSVTDCRFRAFSNSEPKDYLEEHVFPTLLPGIEMLLKKIKRNNGHLDEDTTDPVNWLAQYLMRHNPLAPKADHEDDQVQDSRTVQSSCPRGSQKSASTTA